MKDYVLIQSQSGYESADVNRSFDLAAALAGKGHKVALFLVQNGVLNARSGAAAGELESAQQAGVTLLADDFSLRERGIADDQIRPGITVTPLGFVVDRLAAGDKVIWH